MMSGLRPARQPHWEVWLMMHLIHERVIALGHKINKSTLGNYGSALNSYISLTTSHNLPVEPVPDTLFFYTVYMCHYINPRSVLTYLSGITQQLEPYFPTVRETRNSSLVWWTLRGCMRMKGTPTIWKKALSTDDFQRVTTFYQNSTLHDDKLFVTMLLTGFFSLLHLGEMSFLHYTTGKRSFIATQSISLQHNMNFFYLGTKQIISLKETKSSSQQNTTNNNLYTISNITSTPETISTPLPQPYDSQKQALSPPDHFSWTNCIYSLTTPSAVNPWEQEELPPLLNMVYSLISSKHVANGLLMPFSSTFTKTLLYFKPFYLPIIIFPPINRNSNLFPSVALSDLSPFHLPSPPLIYKPPPIVLLIQKN